MLTHLLEREAKKAPSDYKMKAKLTILLIALTSGAHGNLIDLTPGGFNINEPWPQPVIQFFNQFDNGNGFQFLAGANIQDGQVVWSPFTIFGSDNFGISLQDPANAQVSWNLTNTGGYFLQYVLLEGANGIDNLYGLRGPGFQFEGGGLVTIDGLTTIQAITFAGTNLVPETVNTGWLLFFAVGGLLLTYKLRRRKLPELNRGDMARVVLDCDGVDVITHELIGDVMMIGRAPSNNPVRRGEQGFSDSNLPSSTAVQSQHRRSVGLWSRV
jgi:hypothetical protein